MNRFEFKFFLVLLPFIALLCHGCSKCDIADDNSCISVPADMPEVAAIRQANSVGEESLMRYFRIVKNIDSTRAGQIDVQPVIREQDTLMYLINYNQGWELLSADKRVPTRLMFSDEGSMTLDYIKEHPGMSFLLEDMSERIYDVKHSDMQEPVTDKGVIWNNIDYVPESTRAITWLQIGRELAWEEKENTPHLITTKWGQNNPYNKFVPFTNSSKSTRCVTGCVMVAAAQMLAYLHDKIGKPNNAFFIKCVCDTYIANGQTSTKYGPFRPEMTTSVSDYWSYVTRKKGTVKEQDDSIATLMAYLGYKLDATYKYINERASTGASDANIVSVFSSEYGIDCTYVVSRPSSIIIKQINENKMPVIESAFTSNGEGHCWIIDGYYRSLEAYNYYYQGFDTSNPDKPLYKTEQRIEEFVEYFQMNWGWAGQGDNDAYYTDCSGWTVKNGNEIYVYDRDYSMIYGFN